MQDYILWLRSKIGPRLVWSIGAGAVVTDAQNRLLFIRRGDFANRWGLPAGSTNIGETFAQTAEREAFEETGLRVEVIRPLVLLSSPTFRSVYPHGDQIQNFAVWFLCRVTGGVMQPDGHESLEVGYFPFDRLPPNSITRRISLNRLAGLMNQQGTAIYDLGESAVVGALPLWPDVRQAVGNARLIMPVAACAIYNGQGEVLAWQAHPQAAWTLPYTLVELGERADTAALRLATRLGINLEVRRLSGLYTGPLFWDTDANGDPRQLACAVFACQLGGSPGKLTANLAWLPVATLNILAIDWRRAAVDALDNLPITAFL